VWDSAHDLKAPVLELRISGSAVRLPLYLSHNYFYFYSKFQVNPEDPVTIYGLCLISCIWAKSNSSGISEIFLPRLEHA
jgi:hypothetical protein